MAANDIGVHWPHELDHWVTLHTAKMPGWIKLRAARRGNMPVLWSRSGQAMNGKAKTLHPWAGGSSGMLAMQVAHHVGCRRVVLCGVPMTGTPHFAESTVHQAQRKWNQVDIHWKNWPKVADKFRATTRSMSGRTRDLLGAPTLEWLGLPALVPIAQG